MNFAEELLSWRNKTNIVCEDYIKSLIKFKVEEIMTNFKEETEQGKIAIIKFNKMDFASNIIMKLKCKYQKNIKPEVIWSVFVENLKTHENNIVIVDEPLNKDILLIVYNNGGRNTNSILELVEQWFNTIILPDFKKQYMNWHSNNISFSTTYKTQYSYAPLIKIVSYVSFVSSQEIKEKIVQLAKDNGLLFKNESVNYTFELHI